MRDEGWYSRTIYFIALVLIIIVSTRIQLDAIDALKARIEKLEEE